MHYKIYKEKGRFEVSLTDKDYIKDYFSIKFFRHKDCNVSLKIFRDFGDDIHGYPTISFQIPFLIYVFIEFNFINWPDKNNKYWSSDPQYGFYTYKENPNIRIFDMVWLWFGNKKKILTMPWYYGSSFKKYLRIEDDNGKCKSLILIDNFDDFIKSKFKDNPDGQIYWRLYKFHKLVDGKIQEGYARVYLIEQEWRPKWFKWTKLFAKRSKSVDISFYSDKECTHNIGVGPMVGTYKGGVYSTYRTFDDLNKPIDEIYKEVMNDIFK